MAVERWDPVSDLRHLKEKVDTLFQDVLGRAGAIVRVAASAGAAFEHLQAFRPDVLVSDIGMPGEDGYGLIRRVRALDAALGGGIPSLALTAYTRGEDKTRALAAGFTSHVGKPVNPDDLISAVANLARFADRAGPSESNRWWCNPRRVPMSPRDGPRRTTPALVELQNAARRPRAMPVPRGHRTDQA